MLVSLFTGSIDMQPALLLLNNAEPCLPNQKSPENGDEIQEGIA